MDVGTTECYNVTVFNDYTKIIADPDIAGKGVIIAFLFTAGLALITSFIYAVIADMPNNYLRINKERWCPVLESFLLSLSDQQLLTGLAVLIAGFGRWNRIQVYHWELVTDLAFVSSNTHIATLAVLRKYFREPKHKWIRAWRATAMVLLGIVLFVANAYSGYRYWYNYIAWPMRCVALDIRQHSNDSFGGELLLTWRSGQHFFW